jgi:cell division protein FtsN
MNELARHIASLLLENDCVIIPDFGGFIAHYIPAQRVNEESIFLPPTRVIGFNPQLRINDGLLAQSYMSVYGSSFPDAVKVIRQESEALIANIHETGFMELDNIGELRYDIHGKYEFTPFDHRLDTPAFYGLDSFKMQELKDLPIEQVPAVATITIEPESQPERITAKDETSAKVVKFNNYLRNIAAVAAVLILLIGSFFFISPFEKSGTYNSEASVISKEVLKESLNISSIVTHPTPTKQPDATTESQSAEPTSQITDQTATSPTTTANTAVSSNGQKMYNVIVASVGSAESAQKEVQRLIQLGYSNAKAIVGDGKARVCVDSFEKEADAYRAIHQYAANGQFEAAWVLRK